MYRTRTRDTMDKLEPTKHHCLMQKYEIVGFDRIEKESINICIANNVVVSTGFVFSSLFCFTKYSLKCI